MSVPGEPCGGGAPLVALEALDEVWFQVGGTLCNLACGHCFISCSPTNDRFGRLDLATVMRRLDEAEALGVKEYYFTGGEPFLNRDMVAILAETLRRGPATVLTNGTVLSDRLVRELRLAALASRYSLEIRVSIDGFDAAMNDPIRGEGTFEAAMHGLLQLVDAGFLPIVTMVQTWLDSSTPDVLARFTDELRRRGYARPRVKILPTLRIGMEESRSGPYLPGERITRDMLDGYDSSRLLCSHARMVTDRGVAVCPILIDTPGSQLGPTLRESLVPFPVTHAACHTCYVHGAICANTGASISESGS